MQTPGDEIGASAISGGVSAAARPDAHAAGFTQAAAGKIDQARSATAGGLSSVASSVSDSADGLPGGEAVRGAAHATAGAIKSTADYVRDNDMKSMWADVMKLVKGNPGVALLTAAAAGFLLARTLSRD